MMGIPEPGYRDGPPMVAYSYQPTAPPPPTPQPWSVLITAPAPVPVAPPASTSAPTSFFRPRPDFCAFCCAQGHRVCSCPIANEYLTSGRASVIEGTHPLAKWTACPLRRLKTRTKGEYRRLANLTVHRRTTTSKDSRCLHPALRLAQRFNQPGRRGDGVSHLTDRGTHTSL